VQNAIDAARLIIADLRQLAPAPDCDTAARLADALQAGVGASCAAVLPAGLLHAQGPDNACRRSRLNSGTPV
jgi:electron transfer flavoprotein alpha subunit